MTTRFHRSTLRFSRSRARPPTCTSAGRPPSAPESGPRPTFARAARAHRGRLCRAPRYRQKLAHGAARPERPALGRRRGFDLDRSHIVRADSADAQRGGRRLHVGAARPRPPAVAALDRGRPRRRPDRRRRQGAPLHGRRHRRRRARGAAARPDARGRPPDAATAGRPAPDAGRAQPPRPRRRATSCAATLELVAPSALELARLAAARPRPRRKAGRALACRSSARCGRRRRSPLNEPISPLRHLASLRRPLADLKQIASRLRDARQRRRARRRRPAACAAFEQRGEQPTSSRRWCPVERARARRGRQLGNRISFVFVDLPCDEPDPVRRLHAIHGDDERAQGARASLEGADPC